MKATTTKEEWRDENPGVLPDNSSSSGSVALEEHRSFVDGHSSHNASGFLPLDEEEQEEKLELAKSEDRAVVWLRYLVLGVLACVALTICVSVYYITTNSEQEHFEQSFMDVADKIVEDFAQTLQQRFGIIEEFASDLTSYVEHDPKVEWPFVVLPDYARRARKTAVLADLMSLLVLPRVETDQLEAWNNFSFTHQGWRNEGLALQEGIPVEQVEAEPITPFIKTLTPDGIGMQTGEGPYNPVWLTNPAVRYPNTNVDLYDHPGYAATFQNIYRNKKPVLPPSYDFWDPALRNGTDRRFVLFQEYMQVYEQSGTTTYDFDPVMAMLYPVFGSLDESKPESKELVAVLLPGVYWKTYFRGILPTGSNGVIVILENSCNQKYTYRIDGNEAQFVGHGDLHDPKYDHLVSQAFFNHLLEDSGQQQQHTDNEEELSTDMQGNCEYGLRVYPSQEFEDDITSNRPLVFAIALGAIFVLTSAVFLLYDHCVERRQRVVLKSAQQSGALVQSLFPEAVRVRLYAEREAKERAAANEKKRKRWEHTTPEHTEEHLETLSTDGTTAPHHHQPSAIAQLYPECTMLFADIAGFTKWSSSRSPTEVFQLLETIYGAFDSLARRRKVYKIETIGDCYVAVTGLPQPQKLHAVIMAKFANDCMKKLRDLLATELVEQLGEDTGTLAMRFGLHSGPVTAGVLRGDKQRFQVFGDSVNTASRMESNGLREKIQASQATADALIAAGKGHWLTPREELVAAKGKGDMQTYWIDIRYDAPSTASTTKSLPSLDEQAPPKEKAEQLEGVVEEPGSQKDFRMELEV